VTFVIDTSASVAILATIDGENRSELSIPARSQELRRAMRRVANDGKVTRVAVATGPGSFTGLRVGVSFGLGLAMGLRVPIVPLPTLDLQAARSDRPTTAIVKAGRGRFYFQPPGGDMRLGEPADIPGTYPLVGRVEHREALTGVGLVFEAEDRLRPFVEAAEMLLRTAREVPYRNLEIEYMQSFSAPRK
jgi:tRNA A37 threonylcarbamoyladenosine modification protein TsaB